MKIKLTVGILLTIASSIAWGSISEEVMIDAPRPLGGRRQTVAPMPKAKGEKKGYKDLRQRSDLQQAYNAVEQDTVYVEPPMDDGELLLRTAQFALRQGKEGGDRAERLLHRTLLEAEDMSPEKVQEAMMEMAVFYTERNEPAKVALVYERYLELFPDNTENAKILIQLGRIYRDMGATDMAVDKFYQVLNISLAIHKNQLPVFKRLSMQAQMEIADTYFLNKDYENSVKLYRRIKRLDITDEERQAAEYKTAYSYFYLNEYDKARDILEPLVENNPDSLYAPESLFMLANISKKEDRFDNAVEKVIQLIKHEPEDEKQAAHWAFWKRKAANDMANEFYEEQDYLSALKLYQAMTPVEPEPEWQWPAIYQIGRCFEHLKMLEQAKESYEIIATNREWKDQEFEMTDQLKSIQQMSQWRLNHIKWIESAQKRVDDVFVPKLPEPKKNDA